jgi:hypothetical protein
VLRGNIFLIHKKKNSKFKFDTFEAYKSLVGARHESIIMRWVTYLNIGVEHLVFDVNK